MHVDESQIDTTSRVRSKSSRRYGMPRRQLVMSSDVGRDSERRLMKKLEKYEEDSGGQQKADGKRRPTLGCTMRLHGKGESLPRRDAASSTTGACDLHLDESLQERHSQATSSPVDSLLVVAEDPFLWHSYGRQPGKARGGWPRLVSQTGDCVWQR
jgi:hypothetical protein